MIKFYKIKDTEIRRVAEIDSEGRVKEVKAIIGKVNDLLKQKIIFPDNTTGNQDKWLVISKHNVSDIAEFSSLEAAKRYCTRRWAK